MAGKFKQIPYNLDIGSKQTIRRNASDDSFEVVEIYSKGESDTQLSNKVDKETGKGLSTNDYTTTEKNKLDGIEPGAEVNTINSIIAGTNIHIDNTDPLNPVINSTGGGGGAVDSVNGQTGVVVLDADDISDTTTTKKFTTAGDISKLDGIEAGAEVNNISDVNAIDLTDGGDTTLHTHDGRYYTETETDTLLSGKLNTSLKGAVNGLAELDAGGKVPTSQLPSYVDDVLEFANLAAFPVTGETGKLYIAIDTGFQYRWSGSIYVEIKDSGETVQSVGALINSATEKTTPVYADMIGLMDSAGSNVLKKLSWSNIKVTLKTYFDTLYQTILVSGTSIKTINGTSLLGSGDITISGGGSNFYETNIDGQIYTGTIAQFVVTGTQTIAGVYASLLSLPTGSNVTIQVYKNGTSSTNSIFTSDTPLTITTTEAATNGVYSVLKTTIDNGSLVAGDVLYFVITAVGSTLPGTSLYVKAY